MSERTLGTELKTGAQSAEFIYVVFVALAFDSGTVYLHNSIGTKSFGGNDYLGVGGFGGISPLEDTLELISRPITLTLSSITPEIIDVLRTEDIFGRDADLYLGSINPDNELVGTPDNWFSGHMETASLLIGKKDAVNIRLQSRASRLKLKNNKRYTIEDHQADHPGDLFFEFLSVLQDVQVNWGGETVVTGRGGIGGAEINPNVKKV